MLYWLFLLRNSLNNDNLSLCLILKILSMNTDEFIIEFSTMEHLIRGQYQHSMKVLKILLVLLRFIKRALRASPLLLICSLNFNSWSIVITSTISVSFAINLQIITLC